MDEMNHILKIKITKHFNFNACLKFLDRGYDECLYEVTSEYVRRLIRISSGLILIQVTCDDDYLYIAANKNTAEYENNEI